MSVPNPCLTIGYQVLFGLRGMGGVGKTTTAIAVAHSAKVRHTFGDNNIWWITVGQESSGMDVLEEFARKVWVHDLSECPERNRSICGFAEDTHVFVIECDSVFKGGHVHTWARISCSRSVWSPQVSVIWVMRLCVI